MSKLIHLAILTAAVFVHFVWCESPNVQATSGEGDGHRTYHGMIREDAEEGSEVELDLPLLAGKKKDDICGYTVFKSGASPVPFQVILATDRIGGARIILAKGQKLNYELTSQYQFEISSQDCATGALSVRDRVHVEVEDVNDFAPIWREQTYTIEAVEGVLYKKLLNVDAIDGDGTETFSKICRYNLLSTDVPFKIDDEGNIQNTEPLDYSLKHNYILEVEAEDCGHKKSNKLLVNVIVKPECKIGWLGIKNSLDYSPSSGRQSLTSENASLELCGATCELSQVTVSTRLIAHKESTGCPVDVKSLDARNNLCTGSSPDHIDLLSDVTSLSTDDGFVFDGKSIAYELMAGKFSGRLADKFSILTWLKHSQQSADMEEQKQHILCNADGEGMNRHHYSLFLHNCRLILLLRQEPGRGVDMNRFKPAEWRWKIPEVCDGDWHHYALTVEFPQVHLYVDGKLFVGSRHNPAIIDDWPLHPSRKAVGTKLVVGACWEGGDHHYGQHLTGNLAGTTIINNDTVNDQFIECINDCHQKLDFHAIAEMESGMSISMNSAMSQLSINGHTKESVEKLVHRLGYVNPRSAAVTSADSSSLITMETTVVCADGGGLSVASANIVVNPTQHVRSSAGVILGGTTLISSEEKDVAEGQRIFSNLVIFVSPSIKVDSSLMDSNVEKQMEFGSSEELNSCVIHTDPQLEDKVERLQYPGEILQKLNIKVDSNLNGLVFTGNNKLADYEDLLRRVTYVNDKPEELRTRNFSLMCSEQDGQTTSNLFTVELSIIHKAPAPPQTGNRVIASKQVQEVIDLKVQNLKLAPAARKADVVDQSSGPGLAVVMVLCVGFLAIVIVAVVFRFRSAQHRASAVDVNIEERQEMEWDNSALTITVNPLEHKISYDETEMSELHGNNMNSDDDIGSFHDDGPEEESSDEEQDKEKDDKGGLEWDNTTATY